MAFKATVLNELPAFKAAFEAINNIMTEIEVHVDGAGLRLSALDKSHIMYCHLNLTPNFFDDFSCDEPVKLSLDTEELGAVLKRASHHDSLQLESEGKTLGVTYHRNWFSGKGDRSFHIKLIDDVGTAPKAPDIDRPARFKVSTAWFKELLGDAAVVSDKLRLRCTPEGDFGTFIDGEFNESQSSCDVASHDCTMPGSVVTSTFSLEKLKEILKAEKFDDDLWIELGENVPLTVTFRKDDDGEVSFLLAPRIENEED